MTAKGLGDGLISMVFSHNFAKSGHIVTTFSTPLSQLRRWFEGSRIHPHPSPDKIETLFNNFDLIISQDHSCLSEHLEHTDLHKNKLVVANNKLLNKKESLVDNFARLCKEYFCLPHYEKKNGITPPSHLTYRSHPTRVVLHPFSTSPKREWPLENFLTLAQKLKRRGFSPAFTTSPQERELLLKRYPEAEEFHTPYFDSLDEMACFLYESSYFIGNNSGPGHLASNFDLPTLSLFARKSYAKLWRPSFTSAEVVTPLPFVFGARNKEKSLQTLLPVTRVLRRFLKMNGF
jgi:hypothetical protein